MTVDKWVECLIYKSRALERIGEREKALELAQQVEAEAPTINPILSLGLKVAQVYPLCRLHRQKEGLKVITKGDTILQSLSLAEQKQGAYWVAKFYNVKAGFVEVDKGDLDKALEYYHKGLTLAETTKSLDLITTILHNIGVTYSGKAEIDNALRYYQRCLNLDDEVGNPLGTAFLLLSIGSLYRQKDELDLSFEYLERSLALWESIGDNQLISDVLFNLLLSAFTQQDQIKAQTYLVRLNDLHEKNPKAIFSLKSRLAEALILKMSPRAKDKFKAQEILATIVSETDSQEMKLIAMTQLCELLLIELKIFGEKEVLQEAKGILQKFEEMGQLSKSFYITVEALVLQAKLAMIEGDFQGAFRNFDQAYQMANEKNLNLLVKQVEQERERFETEYSKWQGLIQSDSSLAQRIEFAQMEEYVREAQKLKGLMK
ncbi:MAG: tetratricopeptide repeat protein [Promethearchaeota archaeon]